MINWDYNANDYDANKTGKSNLLPEGKYRVEIIEATETIASNGTKGLEITLDVDGRNNTIRHYIWYNHDNKARTNQLLGEFFNSFDIQGKDREDHWFWGGKRGAVYVIHNEYKGRTIAKVAFCLSRDQQKQLPEWQDKQPPLDDNSDTDTEVKHSGDNKIEMFAPRSFGGLSF